MHPAGVPLVLLYGNRAREFRRSIQVECFACAVYGTWRRFERGRRGHL